MSQAFRIAFADDDPDQGYLLASVLRGRGFEVLPFASGDDLLGWAQGDSGRVDAVLLDNDMPGRDGVECCRALRTLPAYATVPIAFVTGSSAPELHSRAHDAGARQVIGKDETMLERLILWLDEALSGPR
jgi:CheY-like chemotaxis protein